MGSEQAVGARRTDPGRGAIEQARRDVDERHAAPAVDQAGGLGPRPRAELDEARIRRERAREPLERACPHVGEHPVARLVLVVAVGGGVEARGGGHGYRGEPRY